MFSYVVVCAPRTCVLTHNVDPFWCVHCVQLVTSKADGAQELALPEFVELLKKVSGSATA